MPAIVTSPPVSRPSVGRRSVGRRAERNLYLVRPLRSVTGRHPVHALPLPGVARPGPVPLRLTRRGRLVVRFGSTLLALVALLVVVLGGVLAGGGVAVGTEQSPPVPVVDHVVAPGETLWQIALATDPGSDPRDVVLRIVEANGLADANVSVGARIVVPVSG